MTEVNAAVGRMQPFTTGHLKLAEETYKHTGLKTVYFVIDTTDADYSHPFLTKMMWGSLNALKKRYEYIEDFILVPSANIFKMINAAELKGYEIVSLTCGTDRYANYKRMCETYYHLPIQIREVYRTEKDVSATEVRQAIRDNDERKFKQCTPEPLHKLFKQFQEALDEIDKRPPKLKRKKAK